MQAFIFAQQSAEQSIVRTGMVMPQVCAEARKGPAKSARNSSAAMVPCFFTTGFIAGKRPAVERARPCHLRRLPTSLATPFKGLSSSFTSMNWQIITGKSCLASAVSADFLGQSCVGECAEDSAHYSTSSLVAFHVVAGLRVSACVGFSPRLCVDL
jgi:hypothetical protein